ncbi:MAG TPA: hypothetical protein VGK02_06520 [Candidatus Aquicultor sp.]
MDGEVEICRVGEIVVCRAFDEEGRVVICRASPGASGNSLSIFAATRAFVAGCSSRFI